RFSSCYLLGRIISNWWSRALLNHWRGIIPWEDDLAILSYKNKIDILFAQTPEVEGLNQLISGSHHNVNSLLGLIFNRFLSSGSFLLELILLQSLLFLKLLLLQNFLLLRLPTQRSSLLQLFSQRCFLSLILIAIRSSYLQHLRGRLPSNRKWIEFEYLGGWDHA
ncbi:hypothetical protein GIB67_024488, partial [Kingdonia uniflora]